MWGADRAKGGRTTPNHCSEPAQRIPVWIWGYRYPSQPPSYSTPGEDLSEEALHTRGQVNGRMLVDARRDPAVHHPPEELPHGEDQATSPLISPGWIYPRCSCCTWTARWAPRRCSWPRWSTKGSSWWHFGLRIWCICRSANSAAALPWRSSLARELTSVERRASRSADTVPNLNSSSLLSAFSTSPRLQGTSSSSGSFAQCPEHSRVSPSSARTVLTVSMLLCRLRMESVRCQQCPPFA